MKKFLTTFLIVFAMALMFVLTTQVYQSYKLQGFCESTCGTSQSYYMMFGVPRSLIVFFILGAMLWAYVAGNKFIYRLLGLSTLAYGLYLTYISITQIGFLCKYCEATKVIIAVLMILDFF